MKTNREVIIELVDMVVDSVSEGGSSFDKLSFTPAINILKMKLSKLSEDSASDLVDTIHKVSRIIENETGILSPYHGIDA